MGDKLNRVSVPGMSRNRKRIVYHNNHGNISTQRKRRELEPTITRVLTHFSPTFCPRPPVPVRLPRLKNHKPSTPVLGYLPASSTAQGLLLRRRGQGSRQEQGLAGSRADFCHRLPKTTRRNNLAPSECAVRGRRGRGSCTSQSASCSIRAHNPNTSGAARVANRIGWEKLSRRGFFVVGRCP